MTEQNISNFIEYQFPNHYREKEGVDLTEADRSVLVDFVEAYYEWLEETYSDSFLRSRKMFEYRDIDTTLNEFVAHFRSKYMDNISYNSATDERFLIKNIIDLYRSKGSEASVKLLLRLLFNVDSKVYIPGQDVLRVSDSKWFDPIYVEVLSSSRSSSLINKFVFGSNSGATAFVESVVTKRSNNGLIDILYLSNVTGKFVFGDIITDDGSLSDGVKVIGSLSDVELSGQVAGNSSVGEIFNVISDFGSNGRVRVTSLSDVSGLIDFRLTDGGFGYTLTDDTEILIADVIPILDNSNTIFETGDTVSQRIETIYLDDSNIFPEINLGNQIQGNYTSANTTPITGTLLETGTELIGNLLTPYVKLQVDANNEFKDTQNLSLQQSTYYKPDETLKESSDVTLTVATANNTFTIGETVIQQEFVPGTSNKISSIYNFGVIDNKVDDVLYIKQAFGQFIANTNIVGETSGEIDTVVTVEVTREGAEGTVETNTANTVYSVILTSNETFSANNKIRGIGSRVIAEVSNIENFFIETLEYGSVQSNVIDIIDSSFQGVVLEQDDSSISIATTENEFLYVETLSELSNGINSLIVDNISSGSGASFEIASLENTETITIKNQRIVDENVQGVPYKDILLSGEGSGIGYIDSISIISGGSGYSNTSIVTISGGGFEDQNPFISAQASVVTNSSGSIISINIDSSGEGYFSKPTISISDGTGVDFSTNMIYGYGFQEEILSDSNSIIGTTLTSNSYEIGTISELENVLFGSSYEQTPAVSIVNTVIANYNKKDKILTLDSSNQLFTIGETIIQSNSKGIILEKRNNDELVVRDISFEEDFVGGSTITGQESGSVATIVSVEDDNSSASMGTNAVIDNFSTNITGGVKDVAVINSGVGYQNDELVLLENDRTSFQGITKLVNQGIEPGYWKTRSSHLSSEKKLHDNFYYQEYSYDVKTSINIDDYKDVVLDVLHIAGTKFFGGVVKASESSNEVKFESSISQT